MLAMFSRAKVAVTRKCHAVPNLNHKVEFLSNNVGNLKHQVSAPLLVAAAGVPAKCQPTKPVCKINTPICSAS